MATITQLSPYAFLLISSILILLPLESFAKDKTITVGSTVNISCQSNIAPTWQWFGPQSKNHKILAINGKKHPDLTDDRITFQKNDLLYSVTIKSSKLSDAGTYACVGDTYATTIVNVIG